jgi:hypothetical protein
MKYGILILIGVVIALYSTHLYLTKREPVKTIDTIICKEMDGYGEDTETGEKYLVLWNECDTIYKK